MATQTSIEQVQRAYISYYNRPGDPGGVEYWANRLDNGETLSSIINAFANSDEAEALYDGVSTADLIVNVYQQAFGRDPDAEGRDYWAGRIDSGDITPGQALLTIVEGASGNDLAIISNKVDFAIQVTNSFASDVEYNEGKGPLSEIMASITSDEASLASALESVSIEPPAETNSLVGSWYYRGAFTEDGLSGAKDISITFNSDGTYVHSETGYGGLVNGAGGGQTGGESGTYAWDEATSTITVLSVTSDSNAAWGLSDALGQSFAVVIDGDSLKLPDEDFRFTAGEAPDDEVSLVGTWTYRGAFEEDGLVGTKDISLTFNSDGTYAHSETGYGDLANGAGGGYNGSETGTYSWNAATGTISVLSVTSDTNGAWGLSDSEGESSEIIIVGNTLTFPGADFSLILS